VFSPVPLRGGGGPTGPNFGFLSIYAYTLCRRTTEFDVVTHTGKGLVLAVSNAPLQRGVAPALPILGSLLLMNTPVVALPNFTW